MFPDIQAKDWGFATHQRVVLIGRAGNIEAAICLDDQPGPTATKATDTGCLELGLEFIKAAPFGIDGVAQILALS